jgi:hypothetical protein
MKTTKKLINVGGCLGIIIDKPITKQLKLKKGQLVEVDIRVAIE